MTDLSELVERWRRHSNRYNGDSDWDDGYNAALKNAADQLERRLEVLGEQEE